MTTRDEPTELTKLWELSDNGKAEWWPDELRPVEGEFGHDHDFFYDCDMGYERAGIENKHALHIVKGHAEEWLRGRENEIAYCPREDAYISLFHGNDVFYHSLHEAILAEAGREVK